jgi:hypothetical protein
MRAKKKSYVRGQNVSTVRTDKDGKKFVWDAGEDGLRAKASDAAWESVGAKKIYGSEQQLKRKMDGGSGYITDDYRHKVKQGKDGKMKFSKNNLKARITKRRMG